MSRHATVHALFAVGACAALLAFANVIPYEMAGVNIGVGVLALLAITANRVLELLENSGGRSSDG